LKALERMADLDDTITKVLLVEDDERLAHLIARYLERYGLKVAVCNSARDRINDALRVAYDCVVLDAHRDGITVCREVRSVSNAVVVVISDGCNEDVRARFEAWADDYVPMPFSPRELLARINASILRVRGSSPQR
jgi:DNA-binding response OmpR family regulator